MEGGGRMDEKKQIKISFGTIICIFIIVSLIIIIGSMYFYYNDSLNENKLSNENQNNEVNSIDNSNEEQYFSNPAYYALNGNENDANIFIWRKLCKYF